VHIVEWEQLSCSQLQVVLKAKGYIPLDMDYEVAFQILPANIIAY